ncbi:MAG: aspartate 1-decarboxylase [Solirubrobacterales bacterium]
MQRQMLKSKIHRATVTDADLHYTGSITIDPELMREADLLPSELVHVLDIDNGARFETYTIEGEPGKREVCVNGAAARLVQPGDKVIIVSYGIYDESELHDHRPRVVHVDDLNSIVRVDSDPALAVEAQ